MSPVKKAPVPKKKPATKRAGAVVAVPPTRMRPADYERARLALIAQDPRIGALIEKVGTCRISFRKDGDLFSALCETITSQQLSTRVAAVSRARMRSGVGCGSGAQAAHSRP